MHGHRCSTRREQTVQEVSERLRRQTRKGTAKMSIPKTMRAAQLLAYKRPLEIREVPVPEPRGENVLIRIVGSGLCHSDLHFMDGDEPIIPSFRFTLCHADASTVSAVAVYVHAVQIID